MFVELTDEDIRALAHVYGRKTQSPEFAEARERVAFNADDQDAHIMRYHTIVQSAYDYEASTGGLR